MEVFGKLVRDKIPEIVAEEGKHADIEIIEDTERFKEVLCTKLIEEAREVEQAKDRQELIKEIADLREVVDAIIKVHGLDETELQIIQNERREKRGGFEKKVFLKTIE